MAGTISGVSEVVFGLSKGNLFLVCLGLLNAGLWLNASYSLLKLAQRHQDRRTAERKRGGPPSGIAITGVLGKGERLSPDWHGDAARRRGLERTPPGRRVLCAGGTLVRLAGLALRVRRSAPRMRKILAEAQATPVQAGKRGLGRRSAVWLAQSGRYARWAIEMLRDAAKHG